MGFPQSLYGGPLEGCVTLSADCFRPPIGVKGCSYGWSDDRRKADIAKPGGKRSLSFPPGKGGGTAPRWRLGFGPLPRRGGTIFVFPRVPLRCTLRTPALVVLTYPAPLRGGKKRRRPYGSVLRNQTRASVLRPLTPLRSTVATMSLLPSSSRSTTWIELM